MNELERIILFVTSGEQNVFIGDAECGAARDGNGPRGDNAFFT